MGVATYGIIINVVAGNELKIRCFVVSIVEYLVDLRSEIDGGFGKARTYLGCGFTAIKTK